MSTPEYEYRTGYCDNTTDWDTFLSYYTRDGWAYEYSKSAHYGQGKDVTFKRPKAL